MNKDLLFEIGTEETPSKYMPKALEQLKKNMETKLKENRISYDSIEVLGTPRRLTVIVRNIAEKQSDLEELVKGPSKKAAYDPEGNPSKALQGFLRGQSASINEVSIQELNGVDYVYVKKYQIGQATETVLKVMLPEIMTSFVFAKSMKWGNKSFRFARPIRWVLPLLGDKIIEFDKDGIPCGRITRGHRVLSQGEIVIDQVSEYIEKLRAGFVLVDQNERRELIRKQCMELAEKVNATAMIDEDLLEEVLYLVEYPTALMGNFEKEYLKLPKEAVITPMKEHQRYFPVFDKAGNLMNCFITVRNGDTRSLALVAQGNERVLRARLSDAKFFFDEDQKHSLDEYAERLKTVVFQETLGTIYDKTQRIKISCNYMSDKLNNVGQDKINLIRAASLAKADLVTNMVKEFTELQGIMGKEYALLQGENQEVANIILEHYMPRNASDSVAASINGAILGIADRMDTIAGCFAIGIQPTGSQDPYALRRQAIAIISTVLEHKLHLNIAELSQTALFTFVEKGIVTDSMQHVKDIVEFFKGRFKNVMIDKGYEYDVVDAVLNCGLEDIYDASLIVSELSSWKQKDEFADIISSFNRVSNLAAKATEIAINGDCFIEAEECALYEAYLEIKQNFVTDLQNRDYESALNEIIKLKIPVDNFFDHTMVMVEDQKIRDNRLALLKAITSMMENFVDFNAIVTNK